MKRAGLTLLETMVALVILGLVVVAALQLFVGTSRLTRDAETWAQAVAYAENAMERAKSEPAWSGPLGTEALPGGFERSIESRPVAPGLRRVSVIVTLPDEGRFVLDRLMEDR